VVEFINNLIILPLIPFYIIWRFIVSLGNTFNFYTEDIIIIFLFLTLIFFQLYIHSKTKPKEGWDKYETLIKRIVEGRDSAVECILYAIVLLLIILSILLTDIDIIPIALVMWISFTTYSQIAGKYASSKTSYHLVDIGFKSGNKLEKVILLRFEDLYIRIVPNLSDTTENYYSMLINKNDVEHINYYSHYEIKRIFDNIAQTEK